mgnify:CR=1 FL=1
MTTAYTRYVFETVKFGVSKTGKCSCGKRLKRSATFSQTLNPWNKRVDGTPKTRGDIQDELAAEAQEWKKLPVFCEEHRKDWR